jgi:hypothetical protein
LASAAFGVRLQRGDDRVEIISDCAHLYLTADEHDGFFVAADGPLAELLVELRQAARM